MGKLHLVVIDGNELTRALLKYVFHASSAIDIVGDAANCESAIAVIETATPDAVIVGDDAIRLRTYRAIVSRPGFERYARSCCLSFKDYC